MTDFRPGPGKNFDGFWSFLKERLCSAGVFDGSSKVIHHDAITGYRAKGFEVLRVGLLGVLLWVHFVWEESGKALVFSTDNGYVDGGRWAKHSEYILTSSVW